MNDKEGQEILYKIGESRKQEDITLLPLMTDMNLGRKVNKQLISVM